MYIFCVIQKLILRYFPVNNIPSNLDEDKMVFRKYILWHSKKTRVVEVRAFLLL